MKPTHTPGPWTIKNERNENWIVASPDADKMICSLWMGHSVNEANARLISAAPEMFEALEKLVSHWEKNRGNLSTAQLEGFLSGFHLVAIETLKKARGEASPTEGGE
jgi:hypothetical protein